MKHPTAQLPLFPPPGSPQPVLPDAILDTTCDLLAALLIQVLTETSDEQAALKGDPHE